MLGCRVEDGRNLNCEKNLSNSHGAARSDHRGRPRALSKFDIEATERLYQLSSTAEVLKPTEANLLPSSFQYKTEESFPVQCCPMTCGWKIAGAFGLVVHAPMNSPLAPEGKCTHGIVTRCLRSFWPRPAMQGKGGAEECRT